MLTAIEKEVQKNEAASFLQGFYAGLEAKIKNKTNKLEATDSWADGYNVALGYPKR